MKFFEYQYNWQVVLQGSNPAVEKKDSLRSHGLWFRPQNNWAPHLPVVLSQPGLPEEAMIGKYLSSRSCSEPDHQHSKDVSASPHNLFRKNPGKD